MESVMHKLNQPVDKSVFNKTIKVAALRVPAKLLSATLGSLKKIVFGKKGRKNIYDDPNSDKASNMKLLALSEEIKQDEALTKVKELLPNCEFEVTHAEIPYDYSDYNYFEALKILLPESVTTPSGFEMIGHIAHLNLKENQFPWKYLIGEVIREKTKGITTVVNKTDRLSNEYRTPELELISGEKKYETMHVEVKTNLWLDFEKVYWCSRLQGERNRVLETLKDGEVICDAFCGVGPFALRAAHEKNCKVYASDLNPYCHEYLVKNIKVNHLEHNVEPSNEDARKYIYKILERMYAKTVPVVNRWFMNLPGDAIEFLDAFTKFYGEHPELLTDEKFQSGLVHVYCFLGKAEDSQMRSALVERVQKVMPNFEDTDIDNVHTLKSVSSEKDMCCLTFRLTQANCNPNQLTQGTKMLKTD